MAITDKEKGVWGLDQVYNKIKEPGFIMIFPLCILAIGAILGGYLFYNLVYDNNFWIESIYTKSDIDYVEEAHHIEKVFKLFPIFLVVFASIIVFFSYRYIKNLSNLLNNNFNILI